MHDLTDSRAILGTPGYMSPEQMLGDPSDSRSDQFSFCVVLYEALYRVRPFVARDLDELMRRVVTGAYAEPPRDTEVPAWIWKIIARGLAVEPEARHASMSALLAALGRDPAQRRRRYLVAGLILGAGVLAGAGIVSQIGLTSSADPCALAGSAVTRLWSPAVADRVQAAFLATNVAYAGAAWDLVRERVDGYAGALAAERKATCEATHVRHEQPEELFRLKTLCLDRGERHLDALVAALGQADASTVEHSARMTAGLPRIEACRDGESLVLGVQPPEDAALATAVQDVRDRLARAHVQHAAGHHQQAQRLAEEALAAAEPLAYPPVRAEGLHALGMVLRDGATAADVARAEEILLEAVDLAESHRSDELVSEIWLALALLANRHHKEYAMGHQWARRALATSQRRPEGGEQRARALGLLGGLHYLEGDHETAERRLVEALAEAGQSGASPLARADLWHRLGNTRKAMARLDQAREAFEQALALRRAELGDRHPHLARVLHDFGAFLRDTGELDRSRALLAQALRLWTDTHGLDSIDAANGHLSLVLLELEAGDLDQAGAHARRARDILAAVAPDSRGRARAEVSHGLVAFRERRFDDALAAFEQAVAIERASGALPQAIALGLSNVAEAQAELGRFDRALATVAEAEQLLAGEKDVRAVIEAMPHKARGLALLGRGDALAAAEALEQASTLLASEPGNLLEKADVHWALARALGATGQAHAAREQARSAQQIYQGRGQLGAAVLEDIERWLAHGARD
jgi:tetratricopeptide (TPR) repeat protein